MTGPYLLNAVILFLQESQSPQGHSPALGFLYVAAMLVASLVQTVALHQYFFRVLRVGMNLRSAVIAAVYRKAITVSITARQTKSTGEVVNIMSTDSQRLQDLTTYLQMLWSAPFQIAMSLYFLWQQIGPSVLAGVGAMVLFIPFQVRRRVCVCARSCTVVCFCEPPAALPCHGRT
jgi:ATP-binding cassette subfamily C (CFTR/MRP) protein 1